MSRPAGTQSRREEAELLQLLLDEVYARTGYDFRGYAYAPLMARLKRAMEQERLDLVGLCVRVREDEALVRRLAVSLAFNRTSFFRDPQFWLAFRAKVVPILRTFPSPKIWIAACGEGQGAYSMAVVLEEEGLLKRSSIYATAFTEEVLVAARAGVYPRVELNTGAARYAAAGGRGDWASWYGVENGKARMAEVLRKAVSFYQHSLVADSAFNEFQAILCRDVMVNFNDDLKRRVFRLLDESLCPLGALCLGAGEGPPKAPDLPAYQPLDLRAGIFRRAHA